MYRAPTVSRPVSVGSMSLTSLISTDLTYRSSSIGIATDGISPHQSGAPASTKISSVSTIRSGSPAVQKTSLLKSLDAGRSAGLPSGDPASTHAAIAASSSSLRDGSYL